MFFTQIVIYAKELSREKSPDVKTVGGLVFNGKFSFFQKAIDFPPEMVYNI